MVVGTVREVKQGENRVALAPAGVRDLTDAGHRVLVESAAGLGSGISDDDYAAHGAAIVDSPDEVFAEAAMLVKVKEPQPAEYERLRPGLILFTYLHLASSPEVTGVLLDRDVVGIGYETVELPDGSLPLLTPMSEIAGKMVAQVGARYLQADQGGRGILPGGVPGVPPAEYVVIGCGTVGKNAAKVATGLGAHVTALDVDHDKLRYLDDVLRGNVITVYSDSHTIRRAAAYADVLIGAVLIPGARAPRLVTEDLVAAMKPGSVIVDAAVDQGGCVETIRPTTHAEPVYRVHDVLHYGVPNIPAAVPRTATFALCNVTISYVRRIANMGLEDALAATPALQRGLNTRDGKIVHFAVAEAFAEAR